MMLEATLVVRTAKQCSLCPKVKYVAARAAKQLGLRFVEASPGNFANHIPVVELQQHETSSVLFAPTQALLQLSEATLKKAIHSAAKYSTKE